MGSPVSQVAQSTQPQGKGFAVQPNNPQQGMVAPAVVPQQQGKGGSITYPGQSGQPQMGQPNQYSNTVGPWDNASIGNQEFAIFRQPTAPRQNSYPDLRQVLRSGKGKGA